MSYTTCPGCGTDLVGDIELRRYGTDAEIKARIDAINDSADDDTLIDGVLYDEEGFAIHNRERCKSRRARPDCGHSRDCDLDDGRCGRCVDVDAVRKAAEEETQDLLETVGRFTAEAMREFGESDSFCIAVMSRVGQQTAAWMRPDRVNEQPMTLPVSPVWVSNESSWNDGWWAPGCCDLARNHLYGIRSADIRFRFNHDDVGCFLPDPVFCPWCGALIPREVPENPGA